MNVFPEFWMVLSDSASHVTSLRQLRLACRAYRHKTEAAAKKEAARLANANPASSSLS